MANPFEILGKILQKPQSIAMGTMAAIDPLYEEVTRKRLQDSTGKDLSRGAAFREGLTGSISPSDFWTNDARSSLAGKVSAPLTNAILDPLMLTSAVTKPLMAGTKVGKYADAANTFGKLGEGATKGEKVAQAARRFYQGTMAGGGDAAYGLAYAAAGGPAEQLLKSAATRAATKFGSKAAGELIGTGVEEAISEPAIKKVTGMSTEEAMRLAAMPHINPTDPANAAAMRNAMATMDSGLDTVTGKFPDPVGPGTGIEPWAPRGQGVPVDADPIVKQAREYFKYNPEATVTDAVFDLDLNEAAIPKIQMARTPFSNSNPSVPFSDQGALFNDAMMKDGAMVPPVGNNVPQLPPGPGPARPMPATMSTAVEPYRGELPPMQQNDVPMGSGTWDIPDRTKMLNAAPEAIPMGKVPSQELAPVGPRVPPTVQGVQRVPQNLINPPMDIQDPTFANAGRQALESTTDPTVKQALAFLQTQPTVTQQQLASALGISKGVSAQLMAQLRGPQKALGTGPRGRPSPSLRYQEPAQQEIDPLTLAILKAAGAI